MVWLKGQKSAQALVTFRPASNRELYLVVNGFTTTWHFVMDADLSNTDILRAQKNIYIVFYLQEISCRVSLSF